MTFCPLLRRNDGHGSSRARYSVPIFKALSRLIYRHVFMFIYHLVLQNHLHRMMVYGRRSHRLDRTKHDQLAFLLAQVWPSQWLLCA